MDRRSLEYQLEQVSESLQKDPDNAQLQNLSAKLKSLLEHLSTTTTTTATKREPSRIQEPGQTSGGSSSKLIIKFKVGDACEARRREDQRWLEAIIQSVSPDRTTCTVKFLSAGQADAQHCGANELRPARRDSSTIITGESTTTANTADTSSTTGKSGATGPVRRKHTLKEHHQKKEAEQAAKQQSWQSFKQKFSNKKY